MARPEAEAKATRLAEVRASDLRLLADQAFSRAAGAPLVEGNAVSLLLDAEENYPAWLEAIAGARRYVHFETYILHGDAVGERFAQALVERARAGVQVRLSYDWMGALGNTRRRFWKQLRAGGVEVRCYNPPRLDEPFGWLSRDHRKCLVVDGEVAFVTGLCVGQRWEGDARRRVAPWRDTGVAVRGPAVADVARAFADSWAACGEPLPADEQGCDPARAGDVSLRVVAGTPGTTGLFRLDQLVAALARRTLWLSDAYYAGTSSYVQALRAAAQDGVDVRLLVPGRGSDIQLVQAISRAGYPQLLQAGVRVFEWNGPMMHAKTAVADGRWARVGSTNLNVASWIGNRELDVVVEDEAFARTMEEQYLEDLTGSTEIVLSKRRWVREAGPVRIPRTRGAGGSAGRAAAGALRLGNALGAALSPRRVHSPIQRRLMIPAGLALVSLAPIAAVWPKALAWPLGALALWLGIALLIRAAKAPGPPS
ncbi:MAG: phosphatidylserine/phosphatidylglycerophosphate/cardiolipin synthase family protein [Burkholderiales bacterium]